MEYMFSYIGVKTLNLTTFNIPNVKKFDNVFEGCEGLNLTLKESTYKKLKDYIPDYVNCELVN